MILVTGSTGHLGKATVSILLKKLRPHEIAAMARDFQKAEDVIDMGVEVIKGDYNNYRSLVRAFAGIEKLLLISSNELNNRSVQHINAINAAKEAGVQHIVYTSFQRKTVRLSAISALTESHIETEKHLIASGIPYTIFKNTLYMDVIPNFIGKDMFNSGLMVFPAGRGKASFAARKDMAEALAHVLTTEGHENKVYEISGNTSYSFGDVAVILSELSGDKIEYIEAPAEVYRQKMMDDNVPAARASLFAGFGEAIKQGEFDNPDSTLETLLGREPMGLKEFLTDAYAKQLAVKKREFQY